MNPSIYKSIATQILTTPQIKAVDLFRNQIQNWNKETTYLMPCVLVHFTDISYQTKTQQIQEGRVRMRLYILTAYLGDSRQGSSSIDVALQPFENAQAVYRQMQGWFVENEITPLNRTGEGQDTAPDSIYVVSQDYEFVFYDTSASLENDLIEVNPDIQVVNPERFFTILNPNS